MTKEQILPGLQLKIGDIHPRVITCGDPNRAEKIAERLDNYKLVHKNREYWTFEGEYMGEKISVVSHGVGASGAILAFISLMQGGAEVVIRVGTCGGMKENIIAGDLVVATAAAKEEGVANIYTPTSFPAVADIHVTNALIQESKKKGYDIHTGIIVTQGAFHSGVIPTNTDSQAKSGAIALEMEVAALFIAASMYNKKAGTILSVDGSALAVLESAVDYNPDPELLSQTVNRSIEIALDALVNVEI